MGQKNMNLVSLQGKNLINVFQLASSPFSLFQEVDCLLCGLDLCVEDGEMRDLVNFDSPDLKQTTCNTWLILV